jgi:signal transduction histidine kinase
VQELVLNAAKHSLSVYVSVQFEWQEKSLLVVVTDYGVGFDEDEVNDGFGILGMRHRARHLNAIFTLGRNVDLPGTQARLLVNYSANATGYV